MYTKQFDIRWRDLDANGHLGNSSYVDFMSHTRMSFFTDMGIGLDVMQQKQLGPIVFYEHIHYYREVLLGRPITLSLEITGMSEDGRFVRFEHNFYDENKKNLAFSEMLFSWIDLKTRKLAHPGKEITDRILGFPRAKTFKTLLKENIRKHNRRPIDLN